MTNFQEIAHPQGRMFAIKETFLTLMKSYGDAVKNPRAAAAVLTVLEHWHKQRSETETTPWIQMSQQQWRVELFEMFSIKVISNTLEDLRRLELIAVQNNPMDKLDRTRQYQFMAERVQQALISRGGQIND